MYLLPPKIINELTKEQLSEIRKYLKRQSVDNGIKSIQITENPNKILMYRASFLREDLLIYTAHKESTIYIHLTDQNEWQLTKLKEERFIYKQFIEYFENDLFSEDFNRHNIDALECIENAFKKAVDDLNNQFDPESYLTKVKLLHEPFFNGSVSFIDKQLIEHHFYADVHLDPSGCNLNVELSYKHNDKPIHRFEQDRVTVKTFED